MDGTNEAGPAGSEQIAIIPPTQDNSPLTVSEAARSVIDWRRKSAAEQSAESAPAATAGQESAAEADAAPQNEATGETQDNDQAELPPIERPRSWGKDKEAAWAKLDRETQEYLRDYDSETTKLRRTAQNEAAEQRKAVEAELAKVTQQRQQYESALPVLLQTLSANYQAEFADIQTIQDAQRLAREDPLRYTQWDAHQKQVVAIQQEIVASQQRQTLEKQQQLGEFMRRESELFVEKAPEFADETQRQKLQSSAVSVLRDLGFKDEELGAYWRGERDISIHDHRLQLLVRDSIKLREMQANAKTIKAAPKPPVQKPGVPQGRDAVREAQIADLNKQLSSARGTNAIRIAARLTTLEREAR